MLKKETEEKEKIKNDLISEELSELLIGLICVITASCLFGYIGYKFCLDNTYDIQKGIVCGALFPIVMEILIECDPCKTENKFMYIIYAIIYFIISQYISAYIGIAILFLIVIGFIVYFISILKEDRTKEVEKSYNLQQTFKRANNKEMTEKQIRMNKKENDTKLVNIKKQEIKNIICNEAKQCIEKGYISIDDNVEFRTIRDVSDLFNKNYKGFQRSWIKIDSDWHRVASCYQMTSITDRNIYKNILTSDGNCFYYLINEKSDAKKEEAVMGIINHNMKITYLFLKYPNSAGYRFVGVFKKDVEAMKKSIKDKQYKVVYSKIDDKLDLKQFF